MKEKERREVDTIRKLRREIQGLEEKMAEFEVESGFEVGGRKVFLGGEAGDGEGEGTGSGGGGGMGNGFGDGSGLPKGGGVGDEERRWENVGDFDKLAEMFRDEGLF